MKLPPSKIIGVLVVNLFIFIAFFSLQIGSTDTLDVEDVLGIANSLESFEVIDVVDGDTIKVYYEGKLEKIRLIGVNTPENQSIYRNKECYSKEASQHLNELLEGNQVYLVPDTLVGDRGDFDRLLRYVYIENGVDVGEQMIRDGYAFEFTYDSSYLNQASYMDAQREAQVNHRGLWSVETCSGRP